MTPKRGLTINHYYNLQLNVFKKVLSTVTHLYLYTDDTMYYMLSAINI